MNYRDSLWLKFFQLCFTRYTRLTEIFRKELRVREAPLMPRTSENSPYVIQRWPFPRGHLSFSKRDDRKSKAQAKNTVGLLKWGIPLFILHGFLCLLWTFRLIADRLCGCFLSKFKMAEKGCAWAQLQHTAWNKPAEWPHHREQPAHPNPRVINAWCTN